MAHLGYGATEDLPFCIATSLFCRATLTKILVYCKYSLKGTQQFSHRHLPRVSSIAIRTFLDSCRAWSHTYKKEKKKKKSRPKTQTAGLDQHS